MSACCSVKIDLSYFTSQMKKYPSKHLSWWRCIENVLRTRSRHLQDVLKMFWRSLQDVFGIILANTSWVRLCFDFFEMKQIYYMLFYSQVLYLLLGIIIEICTETYSEPYQISVIYLFTKILHLRYLIGFWVQL